MATPLLLKIFKGDALIATKEFDRDIIKIGRLASAHLCLDDDKVSRIHSVIEVGGDGSLSIIDMGSVEGTYVNGKRVNKGALAFGDEIKVGNTTIKLEAATATAAANIVAATTSQPAEPVTESTELPAAALKRTAEVAAEVTQVGPVPAVSTPEPETRPATSAAPAPQGQVAAAVQAKSAPAPQAAAAAATASKKVARPQTAARKSSGPTGLEIRMMWGDTMVATHFIQPGKAAKFTVGSAQGVDFVMGESRFDGAKFEAVKSDGHSFSVRFTGKMNGELDRNGDRMQLKQVIETGAASHDGDAYSVSIEADDFIWVDMGNVRLEAYLATQPKPVFVPWAEAIDFTLLNIALVAFFAGAIFVITALNNALEGDEYADDLTNNQARIAKLIIKPPELQKNPLLQKLAKQKSGEMAAKHRGDEGQMGKKDAPKRSAHAAPKGDPNNKDQARMLTQKIFGSGGSGISTIFGRNGLGGELKSAMGNMFGAAPGDAQGLGGLGLRGSGGGGGGVGDTIGIGGIGTKGRGGGTGQYGSGVGSLGGKKSTDIGITSSEPVVMGSLDKELIRQVIHRNRNQIRYCYESQLTRFPKLNGKVAVKFVIAANGSVASSSVAQATTDNAELETCVAGRVRTWIFPKPKGGGAVIVTYPFVFSRSGD